MRVVATLDHARGALGEGGFECLLVDRMLPDGDGISLVAELRRRRDYTPAICLTARDRVDERVSGLSAGADDYLVKPFAFEELLARIEAVTRRRAGGDTLAVGDLAIDVAARRVTRGNTEIRLTAREFDLLRYLVAHQGRVIGRTRLLEAVWDTTHDPGTNTVEVYVSYLRHKVDRGFERPLIHTVRGAGYTIEDRPR